MSLLVFKNPSIFIEVVIRAGPEKDRFGFFSEVDIGIAVIAEAIRGLRSVRWW